MRFCWWTQVQALRGLQATFPTVYVARYAPSRISVDHHRPSMHCIAAAVTEHDGHRGGAWYTDDDEIANNRHPMSPGVLQRRGAWLAEQAALPWSVAVSADEYTLAE